MKGEAQAEGREAVAVCLGALGDLVLLLPAVAALAARGPVLGLGPDGERMALAAAPRGPFARTARLGPELFGDGPVPEAIARARPLVAFSRDEGAFAARVRAQGGVVVPPFADGAREQTGPRVHAADHALAGVVAAGLGDRGDAVPRLTPTPEDLDAARALLARSGVGGRFGLVFPGAGSRAKRAPEALLARAIALGGRALPWVSILGPAELDPPASFPELARVVAATLACPPLTTLLGLCGLAEVVVGNDAGTTHVAAAAGARVVALFGPTDPARWGPRGRVTVLEAPEGDLARLDAELVAGALRSS